MLQDVLYALIRNRAREHRLACVNAIDKVSILHPRSPSERFPVLYHRKKKEHSVWDRPRRTVDVWLRSCYTVATKSKMCRERNVPSRLSSGLGLRENSMGSAYGSRTRDLRLERAASLATRRMRLTKDYIITPLPLFVKDDLGPWCLLTSSQGPIERDMSTSVSLYRPLLV